MNVVSFHSWDGYLFVSSQRHQVFVNLLDCKLDHIDGNDYFLDRDHSVIAKVDDIVQGIMQNLRDTSNPNRLSLADIVIDESQRETCKYIHILQCDEFKIQLIAAMQNITNPDQERKKTMAINIQKLAQDAEAYLGKAGQDILGLPPFITAFFIKVTSSNRLIQSALTRLTEFILKNVAPPIPHWQNLVRAFRPECRQYIEQLVSVSMKLQELEIPPSLINDEQATDEQPKLAENTTLLIRKKKELNEIVKPLLDQMLGFRPGKFFPLMHASVMEAVQRYFSLLAEVTIGLKAEHHDFDLLSDSFKGLLITKKISENQAKGLHTFDFPIFVPTDEQLTNANINLNDLRVGARCLNKAPEFKKKLVDLEKKYNAIVSKLDKLTKRPLHSAGWFKGAETTIEYSNKIATLSEDGANKFKLWNDEKLHQASIISTATIMDNALGTLLFNANKETELKFLSDVTKPLIKKFLFPKGVEISSFENAFFQATKIEPYQLISDTINEQLWSFIENFSNPDYLNRQLEPFITQQLDEIKCGENISQRLDPKIPETTFTESQFIMGMTTMGPQAEPLCDAEMTKIYKSILLNVLKIGSGGNFINTLSSYTGDFGLAESVNIYVETMLDAFSKTLTSEGTNEWLVKASDHIKKISNEEATVTTNVGGITESDARRHDIIRSGIQELARVSVNTAVASGYMHAYIPRSVANIPAEYLAGVATQIYDITQIKAVNHMLLYQVLASLRNCLSK